MESSYCSLVLSLVLCLRREQSLSMSLDIEDKRGDRIPDDRCIEARELSEYTGGLFPYRDMRPAFLT